MPSQQERAPEHATAAEVASEAKATVKRGAQGRDQLIRDDDSQHASASFKCTKFEFERQFELQFQKSRQHGGTCGNAKGSGARGTETASENTLDALADAVTTCELSGLAAAVSVTGGNAMKRTQCRAMMKHKRLKSSTSTGRHFRGVSEYKRTGRWEAHIWDRGKQIHLGSFRDAYTAAHAYDKAAIRFRGLGAELNFPVTSYEGDEELKEMIRAEREEFIAWLRQFGKDNPGPGIPFGEMKDSVKVEGKMGTTKRMDNTIQDTDDASRGRKVRKGASHEPAIISTTKHSTTTAVGRTIGRARSKTAATQRSANAVDVLASLASSSHARTDGMAPSGSKKRKRSAESAGMGKISKAAMSAVAEVEYMDRVAEGRSTPVCGDSNTLHHPSKRKRGNKPNRHATRMANVAMTTIATVASVPTHVTARSNRMNRQCRDEPPRFLPSMQVPTPSNMFLLPHQRVPGFMLTSPPSTSATVNNMPKSSSGTVQSK